MSDTNFKGQLLEILQKQGCAAPTFGFERRGPPHMPQFQCKLKLNQPIKLDIESEWHMSKKASEQECCEKAIKDLQKKVGNVGPPLNLNIPKVKEFNSGENYKGLLQEYCSKTGIAVPKYEYQKYGPDHNPQFICFVEVNNNINNQRYTSAPDALSSKRAAEQKAAFCALSALNEEQSRNEGVTSNHNDNRIEAQRLASNVYKQDNIENSKFHDPKSVISVNQASVPYKFNLDSNQKINPPVERLANVLTETMKPKSLEPKSLEPRLLEPKSLESKSTKSLLATNSSKNEPVGGWKKIENMENKNDKEKLWGEILGQAAKIISPIEMIKLTHNMSLVCKEFRINIESDQVWATVAAKMERDGIVKQWKKIQDRRKEFEDQLLKGEKFKKLREESQVAPKETLKDFFFLKDKQAELEKQLTPLLNGERTKWYKRESTILKAESGTLVRHVFMMTDTEDGINLKVKYSTLDKKDKYAFEADVQAQKTGIRKCMKDGSYEAKREVVSSTQPNIWVAPELKDKMLYLMGEWFKGSGGAYLCTFFNDPYERTWSCVAVWVDLVNNLLVELGAESV